MLILYALRARQRGNSVILIEQENVIGGAWSVGNHLLGSNEVLHENSCHLIEWYKDAYELIESITGIKFIILEPQPIKVWCNGKSESYMSRKNILLNTFSTLRSLIFSIIKRCIIFLGYNRRDGFNKVRFMHNSFANFKAQIIYRLLHINKFHGMRIPEGGYVNFINNISKQLDFQGVNVLSGRAENLLFKKDGSGSVVFGNETIYASKIVLGESTVLNNFNCYDFNFTDYHHILIALKASEVICRNSYIHFPDHPEFHRITYVEDSIDENGVNISIFLIQLRNPTENIDKLKYNFEEIQNLYKIANSLSYFKILKNINSKYLSKNSDGGWYNFDNNGPLVLKTIGDFSRNMVLMKRHYI